MAIVARKKTIDPSFGRRLRVIREAAGLTLQDAADRAGITYQEVGRYERAEREPTWATLVKLAHALDVDLNAFLDPDHPDDDTPRPMGKRK